MKLLIVDDHPIVREGIAAVLARAGPDTVVLQARDASEALRLVDAHADLDVVLLDLSMPGMDGHSALPEFGRRRPELPVIVLSSSEDPRDIKRALGAGALGYIPKSSTAQTLLPALEFVLSGNVYVPPSLLREAGAPGAPTAAPPAKGAARITGRQGEVLKLLSAGRSNKEIARDLALSDKTVKAHVTAIFRALDVVNRMQAANAARREGLV